MELYGKDFWCIEANPALISIVFRKFMRIVWQAFSPYTWCMELFHKNFCCVELYDKHFWCMEVNPGFLFRRRR